MNLPFFIARRYISSQKGNFTSFIIRLAILATALSVATMVVAMAFINGFKYEIREKLFAFWGHVHVTEFNPNAANLISNTPVYFDKALADSIASLQHVAGVYPYVLRPAILQADKSMEGIKLKGVTADWHLPPGIKFQGQPISYNDTDYARQVVLSTTTANRLRVQPGDHLLLYFLEPGSTAPRLRKVLVRGVFHTGMDEVDKEYALCDIRLLQRINNWSKDQINGYQIDLTQARYADTVAATVFNRFLDAPLTTSTMYEIYPNVFDWLQLQDINAQLVLVIMGIVAIINMAVALIILIFSQAKTVGVLKALGMTDGKIRSIFYAHSAFIAGAGILLGNMIGIGFCLLQKNYGFLKLNEATYYMSVVPVRIQWLPVLLIDVATLILCNRWMWLPLQYIRRVQPAKVLQFK